MARTKSGDKPRDIHQATLEEVAMVGSTAVSVNKIANRAGLSVGTLYRYHQTKDELLFSVFIQAKRNIHAVMMRAASAHKSPQDRLRAMWFALVDYGFASPKDFLFVEMMSAEIRDSFHGNSTLKEIQEEVLAEIQAGIDQNILVDAPVKTIEIILASPALTLARRASLSGVQVEQSELKRVFDLVWRGLARTE